MKKLIIAILLVVGITHADTVKKKAIMGAVEKYECTIMYIMDVSSNEKKSLKSPQDIRLYVMKDKNIVISFLDKPDEKGRRKMSLSPTLIRKDQDAKTVQYQDKDGHLTIFADKNIDGHSFLLQNTTLKGTKYAHMTNECKLVVKK